MGLIVINSNTPKSMQLNRHLQVDATPQISAGELKGLGFGTAVLIFYKLSWI